MEAEERIKKDRNTPFMKNVLMLMFSSGLIKLLGFVYKFLIVNVEGFGNTGNGYYNTGYQIYAALLTLSSVGIPTVISKLVSERVAIGDYKSANKIFKVAFQLFAIIGTFFSLVLFFGAEFISSKILNVPDVKYVLKVLAPAIAFVAMGAVLRGYFEGLGNMKATSINQTLEQFLNCVLTITFVYSLVGKDTAIMAAGGNLSTTLAIIIAFLYLVILYLHRKKGMNKLCDKQEVQTEYKSVKNTIKIVLSLAIPMMLGSLFSIIHSLIDTITISNCVQQAYEGIILTKEALEDKAMELSGTLAKVETLMHLPTAITVAFCTALVPAISTAIAKKEMDIVKKRLSFSIFATMLIILPSAAGMIFLAKPILQMLYPAASNGALLLQLSTITMICVSINYVINGGLYGLGKIHVPVIALAIGGILKLILNLVLISNPNINIYGATISSNVCQIIAVTICAWYLNKHIKLNVNIVKCFIKPAISAFIMGIVVYFSHKLMVEGLGNTITTVSSIGIGVITYAIMILVTKNLSKEDLYMIPFGTKLYKILVKVGLYKECD
ncbi:MAG: polysaccharide biosynthesis protein [Clostridiales bacterium]|nr:polysaccharide biosynthesis protein [Clostridiales bacterium]